MNQRRLTQAEEALLATEPAPSRGYQPTESRPAGENNEPTDAPTDPATASAPPDSK